MSLNYSFANKSVLITGGASGIGKQLVRRFSDAGAIVYTIDKNGEAVEKLKMELSGVRAEVVDLADWPATKAVIESFGKIDQLVNNAAAVQVENFMDITEQSALLQYNVNVGAVINVTQTVARGLMQAGCGGTVVNIASMAAQKTVSTLACYSASKSALIALTKSMALELGSNDIRVNCILPGVVDSPLSKVDGKLIPVAAKSVQNMVIKRAIDTNEIADLVLFLLSPLSAMITGEAVVIDGGWSLT